MADEQYTWPRTFQPDVASQLKKQFLEQYKKHHPNHFEPDRQANLFIKIIEGFGDGIPYFEKFASPKQQKRKEHLSPWGAVSRA